MKKENNNFQRIHFGGITVVNILFILCLCCLSLAAFSQAAADSRLTQKNAATVREYYGAEERAEIIIQKIEDMSGSGDLPETIEQAGAEMAAAAERQGASYTDFNPESRKLTLWVDAGAQGRYEAVFYLNETGHGIEMDRISSHIVPESEISDDNIPIYS